jgi:hypothetical protein
MMSYCCVSVCVVLEIFPLPLNRRAYVTELEDAQKTLVGFFDVGRLLLPLEARGFDWPIPVLCQPDGDRNGGYVGLVK